MTRNTQLLDPPTPHAAAAASARPPWPGVPVDDWLRTAPLAPWAIDWLSRLRRTHGDGFAGLMARGLDGATVPPPWMQAGSPEPTWLLGYLGQSSESHRWFEQHFLVEDPEWLTRLLRYEQARVARSFLLTGNVSDYAFDPVTGYRPAIRVLVDALLRVKDCVLQFRLSQGLTIQCREGVDASKLPAPLRRELEAGPYVPGESIAGRVCRIFALLRDWLARPGAESARSFPSGVAIVFENVHLLIPADRSEMERNFLVDNLLEWSNSPLLFRSDHCLVLLAEALEDVGEELRAQGGKIEQIAVPRPDTVESRLKYLMPLLDVQSGMKETRVGSIEDAPRWLSGYGGTDDVVLARKLLARDTAGLNYLGIEDLLQQATSERQALRREHVMRLKRERLQQESGGMLEVVDPRRTLEDIGGYDRFKRRIRELLGGFGADATALLSASMPMGVLFLGPPGTGKSVMAEALAHASNVNMARLGDFRGKYVGESERNLSRVFGLIESLHPVIVFIDEVDQALGKRGGAGSEDGGVDRRIFGRFLEFMSNGAHRGRVLWVGAANRPTNIDEAFRRPGRFDLALPFTLPDAAGRADILGRLVRSRIRELGVDILADELSEDCRSRLAGKMEQFTGAEIEAVVGEALRRLAAARADGSGAALTVQLLEDVLAVYVPKDKAKYREMEDLALAEVSFLDLVDEDTATRVRELRAGPHA